MVSGLSGPVTVTPSHNGTAALISFTIAGTQNDPATQAIVRQVRSTAAPAAFGALSGVQVYSRERGQALDITQIYLDAIPLVFGFVLGLSFLLLLVVFHSLVIPIKAIALNLLSTGGRLRGHGRRVLRMGCWATHSGSPTRASSRAGCRSSCSPSSSGSRWTTTFSSSPGQQARDRGLDSRSAIAKGISITSGTITSAATIMVLVFAAFITIPFAFIQELGLALAVAVLLDATVVRSILLRLRLLSSATGTGGIRSFLRWLPRVTIEGEPEAELGSEVMPAVSA